LQFARANAKPKIAKELPPQTLGGKLKVKSLKMKKGTAYNMG
jgi:hypothetical protein